MFTWKMLGGGVPPIEIRAATWEEALAKARQRSPSYCAGYIVEED